MSIIALLSHDSETVEQLAKALAVEAPDVKVVLHGEAACAEADVAVCWHPPHGSLSALPRLRLIHSIAAGVDHLGNDPLQPGLPVCRVVDAAQRQGMVEYVKWAALYYHRRFDQIMAQQRHRHWHPPEQIPAHAYHIGVMGLGMLGAAVATDLAEMGYDVRGWARSPKTLVNIDVFTGDAQFNEFLEGVDLLVNLLPLTPQTQGILNTTIFSKLNTGAAVVNCGRGAHMVADDLIAALACGQLGGAVLDVFTTEPLPATHPLWHTPGVVVTPHMASSAAYNSIAQQIIENMRRLDAGEPLLNQIDPDKGY